jgi:hypothetical protein
MSMVIFHISLFFWNRLIFFLFSAVVYELLIFPFFSPLGEPSPLGESPGEIPASFVRVQLVAIWINLSGKS